MQNFPRTSLELAQNFLSQIIQSYYLEYILTDGFCDGSGKFVDNIQDFTIVLTA